MTHDDALRGVPLPAGDRVLLEGEAGSRVIDVAGIGFGPSNLAVAIALGEHNAAEAEDGVQLTAEFFERRPAFAWHPGMLIDGATMQVSFLKDLVTLRNPTSPYSFLAYLHAKGRLIDFINHKCLFPSRIEFHDYLRWCAARIPQPVHYGYEVSSIRPVTGNGHVTHYQVTARGPDDDVRVVEARNVVIAPGLVPRMPAGIPASRRVWHSHHLLHELARIPADRARRFVVLGAGQSAAEVVDHLHRTTPAQVYAVFARFGYSQAEDSPFANRIFDPDTVDAFHGAPTAAKQALAAYHANTNYSVVDVDLIEDLYRRWYQEKVQGEQRLQLLNASAVAGVRETPDGVEVTVRHLLSDRVAVIEADALVCATGYLASDPLELFPDLGSVLLRDDGGRLVVGRDYRAAGTPEVVGGVYLCGGTEHTHGITSSLLSMAAVRAGQIVDSIASQSRPDAGTGTGSGTGKGTGKGTGTGTGKGAGKGTGTGRRLAAQPVQPQRTGPL